MPWYWTDEIAEVLRDKIRISEAEARRLAVVPIAIRRPEGDIVEAALGLLDDDEIPLAA